MKSNDLLTQKQAARMLKCSIKTLQVARRQGRLEFVRLGYRSVRYRRADLERYMEANRATH